MKSAVLPPARFRAPVPASLRFLLVAGTLAAGPLPDATAVAIVRGPYLQNAAPGAVTLRWRTDVPTDSRAWVGARPGTWLLAASNATPATEHELRLTGLSPQTGYFYAVGSGAGVLTPADSTYRFVTPPVPGTAVPTRIWVLGDPGSPSSGQRRVRDAFLAWTGERGADVCLLLGDNAYDAGTDSDFQDGLFTPFAAFMRGHCMWGARGNHDDSHSGVFNDFFELFTFPTVGEAGGVPSGTEAFYSFDHGDIHFVALDSQDADRDPGSPMLAWLAEDLAATTRTWVVAFWHHPPYSRGSHDSDDDTRMREMRENVMPVLESFGVDLVLGGHSHAYERSYLLDGHYGPTDSFAPSMRLDDGDGDPLGDGAYRKPPGSPGPHQGTVAVVAGASASLSLGPLDHPAIARSVESLGSVVVDVERSLLEAVYLDDRGEVRDRFALRKSAVIDTGGRPVTLALGLGVANPVPRGSVEFRYELPRAGRARLTIVGAGGRRVRTLALEASAAGPQVATWDGRDGDGHPVAAGAYFAVLLFEGERRSARFVVVP